MSRETATPAELVNLNSGFNPGTWRIGEAITSTTTDQRPPEGRVWSVVWSGVFVTGNSVALSLDRSTARPEVTVSALSQAFSASSTATLEALRDQIRALAGVLWCTSSGGASAPRLDIAFAAGRYGEVSGGAVTGGASQATPTITEYTPGADVDGVTVAAVGIQILQELATFSEDDVDYTARRRYEGTAGNAITIEKVEAGNDTPLAVTVTGLDIVIDLATDGSGNATTTAEELVDFLENDRDVMNLISVSTSSAASLQTSEPQVNLSGGTDRTVDYRIWGFEQNLWRWVVILDSSEAACPVHRGLRVNVANYLRIFVEITAVSGTGATAGAWIAPLEGGAA